MCSGRVVIQAFDTRATRSTAHKVTVKYRSENCLQRNPSHFQRYVKELLCDFTLRLDVGIIFYLALCLPDPIEFRLLRLINTFIRFILASDLCVAVLT
jgi:hypothetical protein